MRLVCSPSMVAQAESDFEASFAAELYQRLVASRHQERTKVSGPLLARQRLRLPMGNETLSFFP